MKNKRLREGGTALRKAARKSRGGANDRRLKRRRISRAAGLHRALPLRIRKAKLADIPALLAIEQQCFRCDRASARALSNSITSASAALFTATASGATLGYISVQFRSNSDSARIYSLAVRRNARGFGVGLALMRRAEAEARRRGRKRVRLEVRLSNRRAVGLYRALGYRKVSDLPAYYADGGNAMRMEKRFRATRRG